MSSNSSAYSIDARSLSATDGLLLLVTRSLDKLKAGEILYDTMHENRVRRLVVLVLRSGRRRSFRRCTHRISCDKKMGS
jgi:hypothetical protein